MDKTQQEQLLRLIFSSGCPPHQIIAGAWAAAGWDDARLVTELASIPLHELQSRLVETYQQKWPLEVEFVRFCFARLGRSLAQPLTEVAGLPQNFTAVPERVVGETSLQDYYRGDAPAQLAQWHAEVVAALQVAAQNSEPLTPEQWAEIGLAARAQQGQPEAFQALYDAHQKALFGFLRARALADSDAEDVMQEAWLKIWEKLPEYNPLRARFRSFARYWAVIKLMQFYHWRQRHRQVETLFSELLPRFPALEEEPELAEPLKKLRARHDWSAEEAADRTKLGNEVLSRALSGASPPHQAVAFGFGTLLDWKPQEIVTALSDDLLKLLARLLEAEYLKVARLTPTQIKNSFSGLHAQMKRPFAEAAADEKTRKIYPQLAERIVGETRLREYYLGPPERNIVQWKYAVERRIKSELIKEGKVPPLQKK